MWDLRFSFFLRSTLFHQSGDSSFTDCDSVEGFGDKSVTLRLAEERSSDFSDSDESRDTIHGLSPMVCEIFVSASSDAQRYRAS